MARRAWPVWAAIFSLLTVMLVLGACARPQLAPWAPAAIQQPSTSEEGGSAAPPTAPRRPSTAQIHQAYGRLPLHFEENRGQADPRVKFLARGRGYGVFLTSDDVVLALREDAVRMSLVGARPNPVIRGTDELPGKVNYLVGGPARGRQTDIRTYAKVRYEGVYPGVDLVFYGNQRQLEYDFVVAPGADPARLALHFRGADRLALDADGNLIVSITGGKVLQHKPLIYQERDGRREPIPGGYVVRGRDRVAFRVGPYDRTRALVIDPVVSYATYLGGTGSDVGHAIAVDASGNAYIAGATLSTDFPVTAGPQPMKSGGMDAFVVKLNASGTALVYATYLGGSLEERALAIAVDGSGNAYVAGYTFSTDFPTVSAAQPALAGGSGSDAFVAKLNPSGSALVYSTYLGGPGGSTPSGAPEEVARGIAVDAAGDVYVAGGTLSTLFPTTAGAFQTTRVETDPVGSDWAAFVAKLTSSGVLAYATYLDGSDLDRANGVAVDGSGSAYVVGETWSFNFPTTPGAFQEQNNTDTAKEPPTTPFVTKLAPDGGSLVYSTYLGGEAGDVGFAIAVHDGSAHITGYTWSATFPTVNAYQTSNGSGNAGGDNSLGTDAFVAKLNQSGSGLVFSTYLGGTGSDVGSGIAVDASGAVHVTGQTTAHNFDDTIWDFPTKDALAPFGPEGGNVFLVKFDAAGALVYSTSVGGALGSAQPGAPPSVAVDGTANAYVVGAGDPFTTTPGAFQTAPQGGGDAFVIKIAPNGGSMPPDASPTVSITAPSNGAWTGNSIAVKASATDDVGLTKIEVYGNGGVILQTTCSGTSCVLDSRWITGPLPNGAYEINAVATDTAGNCTVSATVTIFKDAKTPVHPSGAPTCAGGSTPDPTPPTVAVTDPANGSTVAGTITVSATASDNVGVAGVQFKVDGANLGAEDATAPYTTAWDTTTVPNGTHTLTAVARDAAGNTTTSAPVTVTVDNPPGGGDPTPPTVAITAPSNGAWTGNSIAVKASATDNVGLANIKVYGNGGVILETACSGTSCLLDSRWVTGALPPGAYEINAVATDTAGNCAVSATVTIFKDAKTPVHPSGASCTGAPPPPPPPPPGDAPPTVSITAPSNGAWTGNSIAVKASATDDAGLTKIEVYGNGGIILQMTCIGTSCVLDSRWITGSLPPGAYEINAVATDTAGHCAVSATVTINKDATTPVKASGAPSCGGGG